MFLKVKSENPILVSQKCLCINVLKRSIQFTPKTSEEPNQGWYAHIGVLCGHLHHHRVVLPTAAHREAEPVQRPWALLGTGSTAPHPAVFPNGDCPVGSTLPFAIA